MVAMSNVTYQLDRLESLDLLALSNLGQLEDVATTVWYPWRRRRLVDAFQYSEIIAELVEGERARPSTNTRIDQRQMTAVVRACGLNARSEGQSPSRRSETVIVVACGGTWRAQAPPSVARHASEWTNGWALRVPRPLARS